MNSAAFDYEEAAARVIEAAGGAQALADKLHALVPRGKRPISRQAVACWARVPDHYVLACETIASISRHDIRPDIFGPKAPARKRA